MTEGFDVVLVDTLYAWAGATDMNSNKEVAAPLACLRALSAAGVAVVLVHHTNSGGRKPAGVHSIPAFFRHSLEVHKTTLRSHGNHAAEVNYRLTRDGGRIVHAAPKTGAEDCQPEENSPPIERGRTKTMRRYEEAVKLLRQASPPYSQHALGEYLMHRMDSVPTKGSGRSLVRAVRDKGMWSPPTG